MSLRPRRSLLGVLTLAAAVAGAGHVAAPRPVAATGLLSFAHHAAPAHLPNAANGGEPSVGVDRATGALLYQAFASTYRVTFDAAGTPAWTDVTPLTSAYNLDPLLHTDAATGRTFAGGVGPGCSVLSYTDDDGASWLPAGNACAVAFDHPSIGSGPWRGAPPALATYPRAVYYCAHVGNAFCVTSRDGGLTFGAPVLLPCGGLHGRLVVADDGTAYLPTHGCLSPGVNVSRDNGATWTSGEVYPGRPASEIPRRGFDPAAATTPDGTLYLAWMDGETFHPMVGLSADGGTTWTGVTDLATTVSPPLVATTFHSMVAGEDGHAAIAYLGSRTGAGVPFDLGFAGEWHLYVSVTADGGATWSTVQATSDPVQRGCIWDSGGTHACRNLLDFLDVDVEPDGRLVVAYADGCVGACAEPDGTAAQSTTEWATLARQVSGPGLY